eukprot:6867003-Prymnesium_polylepis.1
MTPFMATVVTPAPAGPAPQLAFLFLFLTFWDASPSAPEWGTAGGAPLPTLKNLIRVYGLFGPASSA